MHKFYQGRMRPKIKPLGKDPQTGFSVIDVEWIDMERNELLWKETINIPPSTSAFSQIELTGTAVPQQGIFVDGEGKRHYTLRAEPINFGANL